MMVVDDCANTAPTTKAAVAGNPANQAARATAVVVRATQTKYEVAQRAQLRKREAEPDGKEQKDDTELGERPQLGRIDDRTRRVRPHEQTDQQVSEYRWYA